MTSPRTLLAAAALALLALGACVADPEPSNPVPDASVDAAPDAPVTTDAPLEQPPAPLGCGNRPTQPVFPHANAAPEPGTRRQTVFPVLAERGSFDAATNHTDAELSVAAGYASNGGTAYAFTLLEFNTGDRITSVSFWACGDGHADVAAALWFAPSYPSLTSSFGGSNVWHGTTVDLNHPDQWSQVTLDVVAPKVLIDGDDYVGLFFQPSDGAGYVVGAVTVTFAFDQE